MAGENKLVTGKMPIVHEEIFHGTPQQFCRLLRDIYPLDNENKESLFHMHTSDTEYAEVWIRKPGDLARGEYSWSYDAFFNTGGLITVDLLPGNRSRLRVRAVKKHWLELSKTWELLRDAIKPWLEALPNKEADNASKKRRGGPRGTPDEKKLDIVRGWYAVEGQEAQENYCNRVGIGVSTLGNWIRELKAKGKLPAS